MSAWNDLHWKTYRIHTITQHIPRAQQEAHLLVVKKMWVRIELQSIFNISQQKIKQIRTSKMWANLLQHYTIFHKELLSFSTPQQWVVRSSGGRHAAMPCSNQRVAHRGSLVRNNRKRTSFRHRIRTRIAQTEVHFQPSSLSLSHSAEKPRRKRCIKLFCEKSIIICSFYSQIFHFANDIDSVERWSRTLD